MRANFFRLLHLARAVRKAQEALGALREAEVELGWALAKIKLGGIGFLLDDE